MKKKKKNSQTLKSIKQNVLVNVVLLFTSTKNQRKTREKFYLSSLRIFPERLKQTLLIRKILHWSKATSIRSQDICQEL